MRPLHRLPGAARRGAAAVLALLLFASGRVVFAAGQAPGRPSLTAAATLALQQAAAGAPTAPAPTVRRLTVDEAVAQALEANLGIQAARLSPQIQDFNVAQARSVYTASFYNTTTRTDDAAPPDTFLQGTAARIVSQSFSNIVGVSQALPWRGEQYRVEWNASRSETTGFTSFNPLLRSTLDFSFTQPLVRNFEIDQYRWQVASSMASRDIADVQLRQNIVATTRAVRDAYWDLVYSIANQKVAQQSLDLARQQLKDNSKRVEVGTMAPIDILEAEAEVARNEEAAIVAETAIKRAQDQLRVLVMNPTQPDFWTVSFEPTEAPELKAQTIDVEAAVRNALENRTDIVTSKQNLDLTRLNARLYNNQKLPNVDLSLSYGLVGLGGTQLIYGETGFPPTLLGTATRSFGSVLGDVFGNQYASWSIGVTFGYPIGTSAAEAALASARLQQTQQETSLKNLQMLVAATVRDTARQVETNLKRVEVTQRARELSERRLEAEQKKFAVGTSDTFRVLQAQRDLAVARNAEVSAVIDYNKSLVDFEAVQQAPLQTSTAGR